MRDSSGGGPRECRLVFISDAVHDRNGVADEYDSCGVACAGGACAGGAGAGGGGDINA